MFSKTANSSANDSVNTRPKLKAYLIFIGSYILVSSLFFGLGRYSAKHSPPEIRVEEPPLDLSQIYNNLKSGSGEVAGQGLAGDCGDKIKGNIGSSGKIYHLPGGAFYNRTVPEVCFETEADAQKAGFRKSRR